jgi:hypothetical protein
MMRLTDFVRIIVALREGGAVVYRSDYDGQNYHCAASHPNGSSRVVSLAAVFRCQRAGLIDVIRTVDSDIDYHYRYCLTAAGLDAAKTVFVTLDRALAKPKPPSPNITTS